ncbi:MAG: trypsin-like peptidase domain-containing protein [Oscillospiraceae bacterium]
MEDNINKENLNDIQNGVEKDINSLSEENTIEKNTPIEDNIRTQEIIEKIKENISKTEDDNLEEENSIINLYNFYKSKHENRSSVSCVNKVTVTIFIIFICMCLIIFISCMVMDFSNPQIGNATLGDSYLDEILNENSTNYDFSQNEGIIINQYEPPERKESTYMNDDGSYTVAGVAKYASDSIISIYIYDINATNSPTGMGSGIIFSDKGYIITNAHVIEDANYMIGVLNDNTPIQLSLVGMNSELDIAVLQTDCPDISVATMGNSDSVILGEQVVAIGSPAGLTGTITEGIVSSINRTYTTSDNVNRTFIQTDSAISPGNSGGALLNMYGQVIGVTSLKISQNQTYEGLGFAICINDALECAEDLIKNRFRIGIEFTSITDGIKISKISQDCSISQTQLQKDDIITEINGYSVYDYCTIMSTLEGSKPGDIVTAKVQRRSSDGLINEFYIEFQLMPYSD